jgi:hypothetical protein
MIAATLAIASCLLLVTAISVAPATHHHEAPHNPHTCPICTVTATGSWAPTAPPPTPSLQRVAFLTPLPELPTHTAGVHALPPARGPPIGA